MGYEIKHICTVVPNPHHPLYKKDNKYFYFSLFITPRLQFDGTLKEFYEMLYWPEYANKLFWENEDGTLSVSLVLSNDNNGKKVLKRDDYYIAELCRDMNIINNEEAYDPSALQTFQKKGKAIWKKLFHESVPVEAWPIYLKPQISSSISPINKEQNLKENNEIKKPQIAAATAAGAEINADAVQPKKQEKVSSKKEEKFNSTKYKQEFHKKVSALSRYPHILRILGLIHDFKIPIGELKDLDNDFFLKISIERDFNTEDSIDSEYPLIEFNKSVQFVRPYTRCEIAEEKRLRSYVIHPFDSSSIPNKAYEINKKIYSNQIPDYSNMVLNGYLKTNYTKYKVADDGNYEIDLNTNDRKPLLEKDVDGKVILDEHKKQIPIVMSVFTVDQDYFEDRTSDFSNTSKTLKNNSDVVGINTKTFTDEEIEVLRQKVSSKPKISKGFSIKVHGQPGDILISMDEQFGRITDDNIESETSAFMAHHLDCGYRVDIKINNEEWQSLCRREAKYIVDFSEDNWLADLFESKKLFERLEDEPWIEEVRQLDEDGNPSRFEEIARWNGWSITCPPLHNNNSAPNYEADDMELQNIRPPKGSLPKLRFGTSNRYQFRIRTVDICGNGVPFHEQTTPPGCILQFGGAENNEGKGNSQIHYVRNEKLGPPLFFPEEEIVKHLDANDDTKREIKPKFKGEDNETLVVRSRVENNVPAFIPVECVRFLTPQHVTPHFAEVSGFLDSKMDDPKYLFDFLRNVPKTFYKEEEIIQAVPFATDNMVKQFAINNKPTKVLLNSLEPSKARPLKIVLRRDGLIFYDPKNDKNVVRPELRLKAGESGTFTISSVGNEDSVQIDEFNSKIFRVFHAVQRPLLEGLKISGPNTIPIHEYLTFEKITPTLNSYKPEQKYQVLIACKFSNKQQFFPFSTTGELILHAEYNDFELAPDAPNGWRYIGKVDADQAVPPEKADKFYISKSWSNINERSGENTFDTLLKDEVDPLDFTPDTASGKIRDNFNFFIHSYPDTKFRRVKYTLEAISKFSEFFEIKEHGLGKDSKNPFSLFATLNPEPDGTTIIRNSAKPSKPNITSIIPVFTISAASGTEIHKFEHKTFRVYLGKIWFETGLGEQLAVLYKVVNPLNEVLKNKVSIIANDPTTVIDSTTLYNGISRDYIRSPRVIPASSKEAIDSLNLEIIATTIDSLIVNNGKDISDKKLRGQMLDFGFSTFDVLWDRLKGEFYADIEINQNTLNHYSTLLKFAVCRYQAHSIVLAGNYDYRFSDVVMTDMVSILPVRTVMSLSKTRFKIIGEEGSRYVFKNGDHENPVTSLNKIYLISERDQASDEGISSLKENKIDVFPKSLNEEFDIDTRKYESHFIEEYEDIPIDDGSFEEEYNPRNDPRKRLVFFYKIPS